MKKSKILFLQGLVFLFLTSFSHDVSEVYICKGQQSKKYHYKKDCRGLKNCSTDIYSVPLSDAKSLGRTLAAGKIRLVILLNERWIITKNSIENILNSQY